MRLTFEEAQYYINKANELTRQIKGYRFGQALFNVIPATVGAVVLGTEHDFFYLRDTERAKVLALFYTHCVE